MQQAGNASRAPAAFRVSICTRFSRTRHPSSTPVLVVRRGERRKPSVRMGLQTAVANTPGPNDPSARLSKLYEEFKVKFPEVPEVSVGELHDWVKQAGPPDRPEGAPPPVLVDVRTREEQQVSMLPGPETLTQRQFEERGPDSFRGRRIVCYCTAGYRSGLYAQKLRRERGLDAYNLRGSILAWTQAGLPLVDPRDGSSTTQVHVYSKDWALQGQGYSPVSFRRPLLQLLRDAVSGWW
ncbi:hypothetical protein Agub_g3358 [Astrephomene gubernaculifera]|uniref:Rhodanese domain-containing protein n=1 Tax=Astrephomene gubernaculifera TaxID=47775 RepID=A0AAD3DMA4_9CHLO|nr:hypothetical protein Agub_g3358 [Astrephomene gubernaculifera]